MRTDSASGTKTAPQPSPSATSDRQWWLLLVAVLLTASCYFYEMQVSNASVRFSRLTSEGGPSDLYPVWEGSRLLLNQRISPYSPAAVELMQLGFYNYLSPDKALKETDRSFAYPLYVVYLVYPLLGLPFDVAAWVFSLLGVLLAGISVYLWSEAVGWPTSRPYRLALVILASGFFGVINGFILSQVSAFMLLPVALLAWALHRQYYLLAGSAAALLVLKPHLAFLVLPVLLFWALWHWREAAGRRVLMGFALALFVMEVGAEILLPGWLFGFLDALKRYSVVNGSDSLLTALITNSIISLPLTAIIALIVAYFAWQARNALGDSYTMLHLISLALVVTNIITPSYGLYNQAALVLPPVIFCLANIPKHWGNQLPRILLLLLIVALAWTVVLSLVFDLLYFAGLRDVLLKPPYIYLPIGASVSLPFLTFLALLVLGPDTQAENKVLIQQLDTA